MKNKILIVLLLVSSTLCFAEPEIESEWDGGKFGRTIFYKNKTFSMISKIDGSSNVPVVDVFIEMISEGIFEGDTTKDGEILMSMTNATLKGDFNGIEMAFDFDVTEGGLFNCTGAMGYDGSTIEFSLKEGKDGLFHGTVVMDGMVQAIDINKYELFGDAFYYLDEIRNMHWRVQGDSLFYGDSNPIYRVK